ncbi:MAG: P-loop NTPase [Acidobacteria bacterium]|nr:P-loop NTPase [Acidobacteriota bacterium]
MTRKYKDLVGDGGSNIAGQVEALTDRLSSRLRQIKRVIAVLSGKGGVGKSTLTANFAAAWQRMGLNVGVLDADLNGSCMAKLLGVRGYRIQESEQGVEPATSPHGIRLMSMDFFMPDEAQPLIWRGPQSHQHAWRGMVEANALREMLSDTHWGRLDVLVLDLPPGGDRITAVCDTVGPLSGAVVVGLGSEVSQLIVGKSIRLVRDHLGQETFGLVTNMRQYYDPETNRLLPLFDSGTVDPIDLEQLGDVPFDPRMVGCCDRGVPFVIAHPDAPASIEIRRIAQLVIERGQS